MEEIWKDVKGFDNKYQVSSLGRVRSFAKGKNGTLLKPCINHGYECVGLYKRGNKTHSFPVHRLVAEAFVPNPNNYNTVNHIDENKLNNNADNLEWCTFEYNISYKTSLTRQSITRGKAVEQLTLDGKFIIAIYNSAKTAGKINNIDSSSILKCCNNKRSYAGGYSWRFSDKNVYFFDRQAYDGISSPQSNES